MKRTFIAFAALGSTLALAGTAAPAFAEAMVVQYSELDLGSADGQKILKRRIDDAARKVCGLDQGNTGTRLKSGEAMKCYRDAKAKASAQFAVLVDAKRQGG